MINNNSNSINKLNGNILTNESNDQKFDKQFLNRRLSSSVVLLNSDLSNEILTTSNSRESSLYNDNNNNNSSSINNSNNNDNPSTSKRNFLNQINKTQSENSNSRKFFNNYEFELDSKKELMFHHSIGTGSDLSANNLNQYEKNISNETSSSSKIHKTLDNTKEIIKKNENDYESSKLLDVNQIDKKNHLCMDLKDETIRCGHSTTYNAQMADSLSTLSDKKKKIIVRIVTIFSIVFFLICFAMIAFTLRMSEKIDEQIRKNYSGSNFNGITFSTKPINPILISKLAESSKSMKNEKVIQILRRPDVLPTTKLFTKYNSKSSSQTPTRTNSTVVTTLNSLSSIIDYDLENIK